MTRAQTQQTLRQLPVKWALALLALIVIYALAQPALNSRFGWSLPSLARLMGEPEPKKPATAEKDAKSDKTKSDESEKSQKTKRKTAAEIAGLDEADPQADPDQREVASAEESAAKKSGETPTASRSTATAADEPPVTSEKGTAQQQKSATPTQKTASASSKTPATAPSTAAKAKPAAADSSLLYGILKETGRDRYVSVEGLQYNPGSEEGHRLKHLERHLRDMPDRPGKHGVFDGEIQDALKWIDDAYARGKRGAKGVRKTEEEGRTIYEVPFSQPIGYIGGRDGKRDGHPPAKRLRLVVEGSKFITAFPY